MGLLKDTPADAACDFKIAETPAGESHLFVYIFDHSTSTVEDSEKQLNYNHTNGNFEFLKETIHKHIY